MAVDQESADPAEDNSRPFGVGECSHGVPLKVHCVECAKPYVAELRRRVAELERENAELRTDRDDWKRLATAHANAEPGRGPKPVADYVHVEGTPPNPPTTLTTTAPVEIERRRAKHLSYKELGWELRFISIAAFGTDAYAYIAEAALRLLQIHEEPYAARDIQKLGEYLAQQFNGRTRPGELAVEEAMRLLGELREELARTTEALTQERMDGVHRDEERARQRGEWPPPDDAALAEQVCAQARRENANRRVTTADIEADAQAVMAHARFATGEMSLLQRAHLAGIAARMENFASPRAEPGRGPKPVAGYVRVEGTPPNPPTTLTTTAPERDERPDDVANAINAGENRYRQTVLGQSPLLGYPVVEQPPAPALDDSADNVWRMSGRTRVPRLTEPREEAR